MAAYPMPMEDPTKVMGRRVVAYLIDAILFTLVVVVPVLTSSVSIEGTVIPPGQERLQLVEEVFPRAARNGSITVPLEGGETATFDANDFVWQSSEADPDNDIEASAMIMKRGTVMTALTILVVGGIANWWILQGLLGATIGKFVMGIRVVRPDGSRPGILKAFIRSLLWIVDGFFGNLVGFITAMASKGHRRVGDMAAGTYVVRSSAAGQPVPVGGAYPAGYATPYGAPPPVGPSPYGAPTGMPPFGSAPPPNPPMGAPPAGPPGAPEGEGWAAPGGAAPASPAADQPQWDPARGAYIQYDSARQSWLQFDDDGQEWKPIET